MLFSDKSVKDFYLIDLTNVKGRVQSRSYEDEEEKRHFMIEIVAEKVTFLSSKNKEA